MKHIYKIMNISTLENMGYYNENDEDALRFINIIYALIHVMTAILLPMVSHASSSLVRKYNIAWLGNQLFILPIVQCIYMPSFC